MGSQILEDGGNADKGVCSGKRPVVKTNRNYEIEVWVPVVRKGKQVSWRGANKFGVVCCKDAFSLNSHCNFAFCPLCAIEVKEKIFASNNNGSSMRAKRSRTKF